MTRRLMPKPYRCNVCYRSFDTFKQAETHWFTAHRNDQPAIPVNPELNTGIPDMGSAIDEFQHD